MDASIKPAAGRPSSLRLEGLDAWRLLRLLLLVELALVTLFALNQLAGAPSWHLSRLLDLDGEESLAAWFSALQLALIGLLLLLAAMQPQPARAAALTRLLAAVGLGFLFLSADEALSLHERITLLTQKLDWVPRFRGARGVWVFVYALIGLLLLLLSLGGLRAWWRRRPGPMRWLVAGFVLLLVGAMLIEVLGYQFIRNRGIHHVYLVQVAVEEWLEMLGGSLMLCGALRLLIEECAPGSET